MWWPFAFSRPVAAFSAFYVGRVRRLHWKGRPFHRGYRKRPRRLLNRLRPLRFLSYRRVSRGLWVFGLGPPFSKTPCNPPDGTLPKQKTPRHTEDPPRVSGGGAP